MRPFRSTPDNAKQPQTISPDLDLERLASIVYSLVERKSTLRFLLLGAASTALCALLVASLVAVTRTGIGVWGNQQNIAWACDIAGFVFWIGIGHAGTLISAILYLFRQRFRTSINRIAEAMTLFAVITAAVFPVFHLGRVWLSYWLFPLPNQMLVWPNFKSPLCWDVFAISTYFTVSLIFWYLGLIPDLATLRARASTPLRFRWFSWLSLGWNGSQRHWQYYDRTYLTLAGLATPLVVSVHTIVSFDFAVSVLPGWHSTLFPPYFVAGAILSGSAWVAALLVVLRRSFGLQHAITNRHIEKLNKLVLATSLMVGAAYLIEFVLGYQANDPTELSILQQRITGNTAPFFWTMAFGNVVLPQLYWIGRVRRSLAATLLMGIAVSSGMWLERYVIVTGSLGQGFLPSAFTVFVPTLVDVTTFVGSIGLFFTLFLVFVRHVPLLSLHELRAERHELSQHSYETPEHIWRTNNREFPRAGAPVLAEPTQLQFVIQPRDADALRHACASLRSADVRSFDAYAHYPIPSVCQYLPEDTSSIAWAAAIGAALGAIIGFGVQYYAQVVGYPLNLGNKPSWSWITSLPVAFELTILFASLFCFLEFLRRCGLPAKTPDQRSPRNEEGYDDSQLLLVVRPCPVELERAVGVLRRISTTFPCKVIK